MINTSGRDGQSALSSSTVVVLVERGAGGPEAVRPAWTRAARAGAVLGDARAPRGRSRLTTAAQPPLEPH